MSSMSGEKPVPNGRSKAKQALLAVAIPAGASIIVALITTYGVIASTTNKLGAARDTAKEATAEAQRIAAQVEGLAAAPVPVGSVVSSTLTRDEFAETSGDPAVFDPTKSKWALADGRQVVGSAFHRLTNGRRLPDLRGMFLRGANAGRADAFVDPDNREPGVVQAWATGSPRVPFAAGAAGNHVHKGPNGVTGFVGGGAGRHATGTHGGPAHDAIAMTEAGEHVHTIGGGDGETRPNNMSVSYFIRINP